MQKIPSWQDFSADAQEFCGGKVLRGKEYGKTISEAEEVSTARCGKRYVGV